MNDPNLLYVPLKLLVYWALIVVVLHVSARHAGGQEPPRLRVASWAAGARFLMGLGYAIPLALLSIQLDAVTVCLVFLVARLAAWIVALLPYLRRDRLRTLVFAGGMTGLNFVLDRFVLGDWLPSGLANFHLC